MKKWILLMVAVVITFWGNAQYIITTIAGTGAPGYSGDGGPATDAKLMSPWGLSFDGAGNLFFSDPGNNCVRKIMPDGTIITVAGTGVAGFSGDNGSATNAQLNDPLGIATDRLGNLYIAESWNYRIRRVDTSGIITTVAGCGSGPFYGDGGPATAATIGPSGVAIDKLGNLYITDDDDYRIRKVDTGGIIHTIAGSGSGGFSGDGHNALLAGLDWMYGIVVDSIGNYYFADWGANRIREVDTGRLIRSIVGYSSYGFSGDGGPATHASLNGPRGLRIDEFGNLYIADSYNYRIRKVSSAGIITTIAGTGMYGFSGDGGNALDARLWEPTDVEIDNAGNIYFTDQDNHRIRKLTPDSTSGITNKSINQSTDISVYPNPATDWVEISNVANFDVSIADIFGRVLLRIRPTENVIVVNMSEQPTGLYMVTVSGSVAMEGVKRWGRIIKE